MPGIHFYLFRSIRNNENKTSKNQHFVLSIKKSDTNITIWGIRSDTVSYNRIPAVNETLVVYSSARIPAEKGNTRFLKRKYSKQRHKCPR